MILVSEREREDILHGQGPGLPVFGSRVVGARNYRMNSFTFNRHLGLSISIFGNS